MIELGQHIDVLLLENDCVIIPGLGGFIAHYTPAVRLADENIFFPPIRTIGFNPQLKLNDGVLVQSYMAAYDTNFSDATKMVEKRVDEFISKLQEEGKADLPNVGEIRYTIDSRYEFAPYNNKITTPYLYGLDSFEMKQLAAFQVPKEKLLAPSMERNKKTYNIPINRAALRSVAAVAASVILFFFLSTPVENTYIEKGNYAQLMPTDLFEKIESHSLATTLIGTKQIPTKAFYSVDKKAETNKTARQAPVAVREIKVSKPDATPTPTAVPTAAVQEKENPYHIIVVGGIAYKDAQVIASQLVAKGFVGAKALNNDGKVRVSILSCPTREEATKKLMQLREDEAYKNAWLLSK